MIYRISRDVVRAWRCILGRDYSTLPGRHTPNEWLDVKESGGGIVIEKSEETGFTTLCLPAAILERMPKQVLA